MLQYALPIFLGAFLLFQVQPIIARCLLPWFGGTPAVWTTCMLFFQVVLLAGYAYAHFLVMRLRPRGQALAQSLLMGLSLALLIFFASRWGAPLIPDASYKPADPGFPIPRILALLALAVGLPYFVLSTTSPLLQAWFSRTRPGTSPYRLYMLSNVGSLLGLLTYPFLIEPALAMRSQAYLWAGGYVLFLGGYAACAWVASRSATAADAEPQERRTAPPELHDRLLWIGLPALASTLLLAVTNQVCQEVAVIPFLWVLPLSLYLLSFIICFDNPRWYERIIYLPAMLLMLPLMGYVLVQGHGIDFKLQIPIYTGGLFICCMFCHGELFALRPRPQHLTGYYLGISLGGAIGGLFVALLAPLIFTRFYELHVGLTVAWLLGLITIGQWRAIRLPVRMGLLGGLLVCTVALPLWAFKDSGESSVTEILARRNFYGAFHIHDEDRRDPSLHRRTLIHGKTIHGLQYMAAEFRRMPLSYYTDTSGIGMALLHHPQRTTGDGSLRLGVVGLGSGTLACYGDEGDYLRFYEINPQIVEMAKNPKYFTYLADCPARVEIALGDARLSLERELREEGSQEFDVIALDAFSSDAIPAHLLTKEAFAIYLKHLRQPHGVIAVHVSNRALNLRPIAYGLADEYHLNSALIVESKDDPGVYESEWVLITPSPTLLQNPIIAKATKERPKAKKLRLWTDDYYNLFQILE